MKKETAEKKNEGRPNGLQIMLSALALLLLLFFLPSGALRRESAAEEEEALVVTEIEPSFEDEEDEESSDGLATPSHIPTATPSLTPTPSPTPTPFQDIIDESRDITESLSVEISDGSKERFNYHVAEVKIGDVRQFRTAFAQGEYGKSYREYTSKMAADNGAVVAVNGDYYGFRNNGIVIRNGELYRDKASSHHLLLVDGGGDMHILDERELDGEELLLEGAWHSFSFGPGLVSQGETMELPAKYMISTRAREPRTAIGQLGQLHYLLVTVDGRSSDSDGATLSELAELMKELGCHTAYNLDGGGSSTMVFRDEVVNDVSGKGQRSISDIVYFVRD